MHKLKPIWHAHSKRLASIVPNLAILDKFHFKHNKGYALLFVLKWVLSSEVWNPSLIWNQNSYDDPIELLMVRNPFIFSNNQYDLRIVESFLCCAAKHWSCQNKIKQRQKKTFYIVKICLCKWLSVHDCLQYSSSRDKINVFWISFIWIHEYAADNRPGAWKSIWAPHTGLSPDLMHNAVEVMLSSWNS